MDVSNRNIRINILSLEIGASLTGTAASLGFETKIRATIKGKNFTPSKYLSFKSSLKGKEGNVSMSRIISLQDEPCFPQRD